MNAAAFKRILRSWGLAFKAVHPDIPLDGSPERALARWVVEDEGGRRYILERMGLDQLDRKKAIASTLARLREAGLEPIIPMLPAADGFQVTCDGDAWQLQPYQPSVPLDRSSYSQDAWRGAAAARFLADLHQASAGFPAERPFSLGAYGRRIVRLLEAQQPAAWRDLREVWERLEAGFFRQEGGLPLRFAHGDFHPLNILWGEDRIRAVIDWEFCGFKTALYDAALLAGCVGFDLPEYLTQPMLVTFLQEVKRLDPDAAACEAGFVDLVVAIRFGWLREWLVKQDVEALEQEVVYMQLLMDNRTLLQKRWGYGS